MERFGYIVADPCSGCDYLQIHNILYDNILECIENARLHKNSVDPSKIMYFTILSNTDIVQFLHDTQTEEKRFGFCQLTKYNSAEKYNVYSSHKILFETIVDSILATKEVHQSNETLKEREPTVEQFRHSLKKTVKGENDILNQDSPENEIFRWSILYHSLRPNNASSTETQVVIFLYDCELIFTSRSRRPRRIRDQHSLRSALPLPPGCFEAISHYSFQFQILHEDQWNRP
ncbi:hypothetical protein AVEN_18077-1 [Araneus ventricosus]|uniref:Uncharacterized protein n=1 Tax=Araneus ventricosus TaxID=182803 RepID=A0A4Y2BU35_ARAVE|nr:hypothetical protein AVEN_18077-1 [Araneus ventricosus]